MMGYFDRFLKRGINLFLFLIEGIYGVFSASLRKRFLY